MRAVAKPARVTPTSGTTLIETLIAMSLLVFVIATMINLVSNTSESQQYTERMSRAVEVNQSILDDMRNELLSTATIFQADLFGDGYLATLDTDPTAPRLADSKLPTGIVGGIFAKETTSGATTGNVLLFAAQAWTTEFGCSSGNSYRIDVYRLVHYYMTEEEGGPAPGSPLGLNLSKFVSEPLADGGQLDGVTDPTDLQEVLTHLVSGSADANGQSHPPAKLVWRRRLAVSETGAVSEIDPATGALSATPLPPRPSGSWRILRDAERSRRGLLHYRRFSVASNYGNRRLGVARFGLKSNVGGGFPHGFEVQIAGPTSARRVLVHLTIVSTNHKGIRAHSDLRTVTFVHDT